MDHREHFFAMQKKKTKMMEARNEIEICYFAHLKYFFGFQR